MSNSRVQGRGEDNYRGASRRDEASADNEHDEVTRWGGGARDNDV